ncbi:PilZ domain-containing protein [Lysobacter koreensis]|uniref:PilZ domain-containing protein n=1 Tax=Lysobacter koreensis TaxID=266122 RepID=A0ABW2YJE5_9GAMM
MSAHEPGHPLSAIDEAERRLGERLPFAARVMVVRGESAWFAELLDVSEGGCGIAFPAACTLAEEDVVRLFFYRDDDQPAVVVPARVARLTAIRIGIEYQEPQSIPPGPVPR